MRKRMERNKILADIFSLGKKAKTIAENISKHAYKNAFYYGREATHWLHEKAKGHLKRYLEKPEGDISESLCEDRKSIRRIAKHLGIPFLVHFTRIENVPSIMKYGLYPRSRLSELPYKVITNDEMRLDGYPEAVSLSIAFPNHKMFYKYRNVRNGDWAVLLIDSSVLWEYECAFCKHNAADSKVRYLPLEYLKSPRSFASMFKDNIDEFSRHEQALMLYDPTDPQAEVLVFDIIQASKIKKIIVENDASKQKLLSDYGIKAQVDNSFFHARCFIRRKCFYEDTICLCKERKNG